MLFAIGMKLVVHNGVDYREVLVVGLAVLIGVSCQYGLLFSEYVSEFAGGLLRNGMTAGEETLLTLLRQDESGDGDSRRRMLLAARKEKGCAVLEFVVTPRDENFQDRLALLGEHTGEIPTEREVSLRLLQHLTSSVHHQQYHDTDIVTVRVNLPAPHEAQP